jgi:hypothetical protein
MPTTPRPRKSTAAKSRKGPSLAARADKYDCYQRAVQCVESEIDFVDETFRTLRGRKAVRLREDFCGTGNTSCEWVRRRPGNVAIGLDLDPVPLEWGRKYLLSRLKPAQLKRIDLRESDVLAAHPDMRGTLDIVLAMNFSFWTFHDRPTMLAYFKRVREDLTADGVFFLDFYGGSDAIREIRERRKVPRAGSVYDSEPSMVGFTSPFTYIWQQESYNPITGDLLCHIHFAFPDGSKINKAFTYEWRLWTLREIRDLLTDAGFSKTTVYWEGDDKEGGGNGEFTATEKGEACASWVCYLSAEK